MQNIPRFGFSVPPFFDCWFVVGICPASGQIVLLILRRAMAGWILFKRGITMKLNRSICLTCRHLPDCCLTLHKGFITYCSEYEHSLEDVRDSYREEAEVEILFI